MTTGEYLVSISSLPTGTAEEHLLNIEGGTGGDCEALVPVGFEVDVSVHTLGVSLTPVGQVEVETDIMSTEVTVDTHIIQVEVTPTNIEVEVKECNG